MHNGVGNEAWVEEFFVNSEDYGGGSPYHSLPADLNGDGDYELVNHTWNNFNFYNITSPAPNQYEIADIGTEGSHYQATEDDQVAIFGGAATDIDEDGNDEAYFVSYGTWGNGQGDVYVIDYDAGDEILNINHYTVSFLSESQEEIAHSLAQKNDHSLDSIKHKEVSNGLIIEGCIGWISCTNNKTIDSGDHSILVADVIDCQENSCLLYTSPSPRDS